MHNGESSAEGRKVRRNHRVLEEVPKGRIVWQRCYGRGNRKNGRVEFMGRGESGKREAGGKKNTKDYWKSHKGPLFYVYLKQQI